MGESGARRARGRGASAACTRGEREEGRAADHRTRGDAPTLEGFLRLPAYVNPESVYIEGPFALSLCLCELFRLFAAHAATAAAAFFSTALLRF